jgi:hypothetical protein
MTSPRQHFDDERWTGIVDAMAVGETVDDADMGYVRAHADEPEARVEEHIWSAVAQLGTAPVDSEVDDDVLIDRVVQGVRPTPADDVAARRFTVVAGGMAAAMAIAAGVVLWIGSASEPAGVVAPEGEGVAAAPVSPATKAANLVDSGVLLADADLLRAGDAVALERWMDVQTERACIATPTGTVCSTQGTRLRLHEGDGIEVERGRTEVAAAGSGGIFVDTPQGRVRTGQGSFAVDVAPETRVVTVITLVAPVMVEDPIAGERELSQGATWVMGTEEEVEAEPVAKERVARTPPPSAEELLTRAQDLHAERDHKGAAAAFRKLIATYPKSTQAQPALVTLANLELKHLGRPAASLRHYNRYLRTGGDLAEEALAGRIEALERLGRKKAEAAAIGVFLDKYPESRHVPRLRARQQQLSGQ